MIAWGWCRGFFFGVGFWSPGDEGAGKGRFSKKTAPFAGSGRDGKICCKNCSVFRAWYIAAAPLPEAIEAGMPIERSREHQITQFLKAKR